MSKTIPGGYYINAAGQRVDANGSQIEVRPDLETPPEAPADTDTAPAEPEDATEPDAAPEAPAAKPARKKKA